MNADVSIILRSFEKHITLSEDEQQYFLSLLTPVKFKKKYPVLRPGEIAHEAAFVVEGCLRSYSIDDNGFEHIIQFAPEGWWMTDMYSFISQRPAQLYIEPIVDTEAFLFSRVNQMKLFDDIPKFERYFRIITENSLVAYRQRVVDNLGLNAQQRYEQFCVTYPTLIQILPQKQVASYIGVTPEFLSKMKKGMMRKR